MIYKINTIVITKSNFMRPNYSKTGASGSSYET